jgi:hypothetical protein
MRPDQLERQLRARLDALGPAPRAELLHVLMLPDLERADRIGEFWGYPESRTAGQAGLRKPLRDRRRLTGPRTGAAKSSRGRTRTGRRLPLADRAHQASRSCCRPPPARTPCHRACSAVRAELEQVQMRVFPTCQRKVDRLGELVPGRGDHDAAGRVLDYEARPRE